LQKGDQKFETIVELNDQENESANSQEEGKENSKPKKEPSEERLLIVVDIKAIFQAIFHQNLQNKSMHKLTQHLFTNFPYFEVKGAENFKSLQKKMVLRNYKYDEVLFSLGR
jgi:hypothetical protein